MNEGLVNIANLRAADVEVGAEEVEDEELLLKIGSLVTNGVEIETVGVMKMMIARDAVRLDIGHRSMETVMFLLNRVSGFLHPRNLTGSTKAPLHLSVLLA